MTLTKILIVWSATSPFVGLFVAQFIRAGNFIDRVEDDAAGSFHAAPDTAVPEQRS